MHRRTRRASSLILAAILAGPAVSSPQTPPVPVPTAEVSIPSAMARMQANDIAGAIAILDKVVTLDPGNGRAWRVLGAARHGHKDFDQAIEAFLRALEQYAGAATGAGRAYLYSGADGRLIKTFTCRTPGDAFGFDAVTMGDVDGDGTSDFLITSAWSGIHGFHSGRVFIVSSGLKRGK